MSRPRDSVSDIVDPAIRAYLDGLVGDEDPLLDEMEAYSAERGFPLIGREAGRWLERLTAMVGATRVFEYGSGFGYSAFFFARAVGPSGEVIGAERDEVEIDKHKALYAGHPLASRIHLHHGWADDVLDATSGLIDVFLFDHDKAAYAETYERVLPRLRAGGLILADNTLWGGKTAYPSDQASTQGLQAFNRIIHSDARVDAGILPVGDGLAVVRKR